MEIDLNELERLPNTASPAVVRELVRRLRAAEAQQNSYRAVLEMAHRLDTLDIRAHKKADGLLLINGIGKSRFATIKERVLYRLFGTLPREV